MTSKTLELNPTHPLASELSSLRLAVSRFQDEAYTTSVKLQRYSLESANAYDRATYLERENEVLRTELAILRANPHPDASRQAHPAVAQVQQLTLSLRRISDKLSLTEAALLERTTQLSHATADAGKAKLAAEAAYELAARTRGREEAGKLRELELEQKVKAAEEAVKMSDLVVNEYADLVRSLQADKSHERLVDGLAEGKLGLQRLLNEFNADTARLQKELLEAQQALTVAESQRDSEKKHIEQCRVELAQAQFELHQLKIDDNVAAKMVSRYMKFSQKSTDTLSKALSSLKTRHSATTSTLSSQLLSLRSQLHASTSQTETLRRVLDELGGELAKEAFGRRREVALRIRMVNWEEKIRGELERWVLKAEEVRARALTGDNRDDEDFGKMVSAARALLKGTFGGEDGEIGRVVVAEAAVKELMMELERETGRRLELEKIVALLKVEEAAVADGDGDVGHNRGDEVLEMPEQSPEASPTHVPVKDDTTAPVTALASETPLLTVAEAESSQKPAPEDLVPLTNTTTANDRHEPPPQQLSTSPPTSTDTSNDQDEKVVHSLLTHSQLLSIPTETSPNVIPPEIPVKDDTPTPIPEIPLPTVAEAESSQKQIPEDSTPLASLSTPTTNDDINESLLYSTAASPPRSNDISNDEEGEVPHLSPAHSLPLAIPDGTSTCGMEDVAIVVLSVDSSDNSKVSTPTVVEPVVVVNTPPDVSLNGSAHQQDLATVDGTTASEGDSSTVEQYGIPEDTKSRIDNIMTGPGISSDVEDDYVSPEEQRSADVALNWSTSSGDQLNSVDQNSTLEAEHEPPPAPNPFSDTSSPTPEPTSKPSDISPVSHALLPPTFPSPNPLSLSLDTPSPAHPLLAELAKTKHRYDTLQRSLRDCHLALESLSASFQSVVTGHMPAEALRTAVQRLNDYTEDARVELEIRIADEEIVGRGFEMMLCVPGALATPTSHSHSNLEQEQDQDTMTHLDLERQVETFVNGTDPTVNKAVRSLSRKLEDIEHDIAVLQRAVHDTNDTDATLFPPPSSTMSTNTNEGGGRGWTSWIRSIPSSPSPSPSSPPLPTSASSLGPAPTFGSVMSSPRLRHSPSLDFLGVGGKKGLDPLASLALRVPMPSYIQHHQAPAAVQPRSRTLSTMYMLGLGARSVSGSGNGNGLFGGSTSPRKGVVAPEPQNESDEDEDESDVE